jgi:branched-chain amino acid transport system ATP-binding protein
MGAYVRSDSKSIADDQARVYDLFPRLQERRTQLAGTMSGGEQQMLAIGRALVAPQTSDHGRAVDGAIADLRGARVRYDSDHQPARHHHLHGGAKCFMALSIAHRGYVLRSGHVVLEGPASDQVRREYMGGA